MGLKFSNYAIMSRAGRRKHIASIQVLREDGIKEIQCLVIVIGKVLGNQRVRMGMKKTIQEDGFSNRWVTHQDMP